MLVQEAGAGAAFLYILNRNHLAAEPVLALLQLRLRLVEKLKDRMKGWAVPPFHASLFGSAARGDGSTESDIDLLIVRPAATGEDYPVWRDALDSVAEAVLRWTGNHASVIEISVDEVERLRRERPEIVMELKRDAITLIGSKVEQLLEGQCGEAR